MQVFIIAIGLPDIALQSVNCEVHLAQSDGLRHPLDAVNADLTVSVLFVVVDEFGALDEHTPGAAGGIEDASLEGFDDFDNQLNERGRREELAAALPFGHGEVTEEILVDLAECVSLNLHRNLLHDTQKFDQRALFEAVVGLGQDAVHLWVLRLNGFHGVGNRLTDVLILGQIQQMSESRLLREIKNAACLVLCFAYSSPSAARRFVLKLILRLREFVVRVAQEYQAQYGDGVFGRPEFGVGSQFIGGAPQASFEFV